MDRSDVKKLSKEVSSLKGFFKAGLSIVDLSEALAKSDSAELEIIRRIELRNQEHKKLLERNKALEAEVCSVSDKLKAEKEAAQTEAKEIISKAKSDASKMLSRAKAELDEAKERKSSLRDDERSLRASIEKEEKKLDALKAKVKAAKEKALKDFTE